VLYSNKFRVRDGELQVYALGPTGEPSGTPGCFDGHDPFGEDDATRQRANTYVLENRLPYSVIAYVKTSDPETMLYSQAGLTGAHDVAVDICGQDTMATATQITAFAHQIKRVLQRLTATTHKADTHIKNTIPVPGIAGVWVSIYGCDTNSLIVGGKEDWDKVTVSGGGPVKVITQRPGTFFYSYRQLKTGKGLRYYRKSNHRHAAGKAWGCTGKFNAAVAQGTTKNCIKEWCYYSCSKEEYDEVVLGTREKSTLAE